MPEKTIVLLLGAGRSSGALIRYLLDASLHRALEVWVADTDVKAAQRKVGQSTNGKAFLLDVKDTSALNALVAQSQVVVSLLPPPLHPRVAGFCLEHRKHLITASYVSPEIAAMHQEAERKGIGFLMECGLDPGIDHMSAMEVINRIRRKGGKITSFKSFTGGLVAPENDNNPWHYKITWNPRNVVLAGKGMAKFKRNNLNKYVPYHRLFTRLEHVVVPGYGDFEGYFNRDSLQYREVYGLQDIPTIIRGTLRRPGFCASWNAVVQLGLTDDSFEIEHLSQYTYRDFVNMFLMYKPNDTVEKKVADALGVDEQDPIMENLTWLGMFESQKIPLKQGSPADVVQLLLEQKLAFAPDDKDMVVMQHQFEYEQEGKKRSLVSSMVLKGDKGGETAMAKTVGWPLALAALMMADRSLTKSGVFVPTEPALYEPMLATLKTLGVSFHEEEYEL